MTHDDHVHGDFAAFQEPASPFEGLNEKANEMFGKGAYYVPGQQLTPGGPVHGGFVVQEYPEVSGGGVPYPNLDQGEPSSRPDHPEYAGDSPTIRPVDSVAVVSGGMDSVTMLYLMVKTMQKNPLVLSFNYGQKHKKELEFAKWHADKLGLAHHIIDLTDLQVLLGSSALVGGQEVPEGHYADENMKATVVPNRNMLMISIATAALVNFKGDTLGVGMHAGDHPIYPDCRPAFLESIEHTISVANEGFIDEQWSLFAPFQLIGKHDIVSVGSSPDVAVPYEMTWSCYKGGDLHCGLCGTCVERKEAFELAKVDDPTVYSYEGSK